MGYQDGKEIRDENGHVIGIERSDAWKYENAHKLSPGELASKRFHEQAMAPVGILLLLFAGLCMALAFLVQALMSLPRWAWVTIEVVAGAIALFLAYKLAMVVRRAYARSPVLTLIGCVIALGTFAYAGERVYSISWNSSREVALDPNDISAKVFRSEKNGIAVYQLFAVPEKWSASMTIDRDFKGVRMNSGGAIHVKANGSEVQGNHFQPKAGDVLEFRAAKGTTPIGVLVFLRPPTAADLNIKAPLPVLK